MNTEIFQLIEYTNRSIFLTGKAGTGKTTLLNHFVRNTKKNHIVVAPTGIAAINAGGVTIHSMFGLPLRTFFPTEQQVDESLGNNIPGLFQHIKKTRKNKQKLLRELEIIIIDEVSMLRADVLDMIDFTLKFVRRNPQPFGGVQVLFIGDLYQLPPVVRDEQALKQYYATPFFFSAKSIANLEIITVELTKVHRQKDEAFVEILNEIRDGNLSEANYEKLNARYIENFEPAKDETYVYLSTHNRTADDINQKKLSALPGKSYTYKAKIDGEFYEGQYPNDEVLELKVGAQVMFIRNDASGERRYYNGRLAEVLNLTADTITVLIAGDDEPYTVKKETWENKRYTLAEDKSIKEEVLGSFLQYPIRLAWAVTIHKSQGLTFDKLIIDAGRAFASGQVYVALSRCRTLEGIVLKSKIPRHVVFSDYRVREFQSETNANDRLVDIINTEKYDYAINKVLTRLDCRWLGSAVEDWYNQALVTRDLSKEKVRDIYQSVHFYIKNWHTIFERLEKVLKQKVLKLVDGKDSWESIEAKARGAVGFYFKEIQTHLFQPMKDFYAETKGVKGLKTYNQSIRVLLDDLEDYLNDLKQTHLIDTPLFSEDEVADITTAVKKIPTHIKTYQMFQEGLSVGEIAKKRGLVSATVYGHLAKFAEQGLLDLERLMSKHKIELFKQEFSIRPQSNLNDWKKILPEDYEYHEIRMLWNHFKHQTK